MNLAVDARGSPCSRQVHEGSALEHDSSLIIWKFPSRFLLGRLHSKNQAYFKIELFLELIFPPLMCVLLLEEKLQQNTDALDLCIVLSISGILA